MAFLAEMFPGGGGRECVVVWEEGGHIVSLALKELYPQVIRRINSEVSVFNSRSQVRMQTATEAAFPCAHMGDISANRAEGEN